MYSLTHKNYEKSQIPIGYKFLVTYTLPKCYYTKNVLKQKEAMIRRVKELSAIIDLYNAHGCYEFTKKGNLHVHMMANIAIDNKINDETREIIAMARLKTRGVHDVQIIKKYDNVTDYIVKDVVKTTDIFKHCGGNTSAQICSQFIIHVNEDLTYKEYLYNKSMVTPESNNNTPNNIIKQLDVKETEKVECTCDCLDNINVIIN